MRILVNSLTADEQDPQDKVRLQWDKEARERREQLKKSRRDGPRHEEDDEEVDKQKNLLKYITYARLAAVENAGYGDAGDFDKEVTKAEAQISGIDLLEGELANVTFTLSRSHKQKHAMFGERVDNGKWSSSRIDGTIKIIQNHLARRAGKVVVFSEFLCTLDVLAVVLLEKLDITCLRFDGTMSAREIAASVTALETDKASSVLLITNRSGGLGRSFTDARSCTHGSMHR